MLGLPKTVVRRVVVNDRYWRSPDGWSRRQADVNMSRLADCGHRLHAAAASFEQKAVIARRGNGPFDPAGTVFSLCKKPDDLGECGAILPEKLMAALEHAQRSPRDSSHHAVL
jgi:hypothetical protein